MEKIARFAIEHPVTIFMLVIGVLLLGGISYSKLGMELFPNLNSPRLYIQIKSGERPPEEMEKQFVQNLEGLAIRQKNASSVSSVCRVGAGFITVEYVWDTDMDEAYLDLQKAVGSAGQKLTVDELTVSQYDPNDTPVMLVGLSHKTLDDMDALRKTAENYIRGELVRLSGVGDVKISGQDEKEVQIKTDEYLLQSHGLTPSALASQIQNYNRNVSGGTVVEMGSKYVVKGVGVFSSLEDFEEMIVGFGTTKGLGGTSARAPIHLRDVASVSLENKDPVNIVRINGKRCLGLSIYKETGANTILSVSDISKELDKLRQALPNYEFTIIQNQGEFIRESINEVKQTAVIGIILAIGVLYLFLRQFGATAVISLSIPISVVATFAIMYFKGLTLNIMTLGGLVLGVGMLVDNAVVVVENIFRNREEGLPITQASILGTSQVAGAVTASTLTSMVVFLPIVYLHGIAGELFKDQAWTVAFSHFASLPVALLVVPMLSSKFLGRTNNVVPDKALRFPKYKAFLSRMLLNKKWILIGSASATIISLALFPLVGKEFFPQIKSRQFTIFFRLAPGTALVRTQKTVENFETLIRASLSNELEMIYSQSGPSTDVQASENIDNEDENTAHIRVTLKQKSRLDAASAMRQLSKTISSRSDMELEYRMDQSVLQNILGNEETPVVVEVKGDDLQVLETLCADIKQKMSNLQELRHIQTNFEQGAPQIEVVVDRLRAGTQNVGASDIASQLKEKLEGQTAGQWDNEGELKDILVKLPSPSVAELTRLQLRVGTQNLPLTEVAQIRNGFAPKEILRVDQSRVGRVSAQMGEGVAFSQVIDKVSKALKSVSLPPKYRVEIAGDELKRRESFKNLAFALALSILLVYMVLAAQFESLLHPFTIILSVPFAGVGVVFAFLLLGRTFNIMAYIGMIMLAGIAVNDSIILLDAILKLRAQGLSRHDAIVTAGSRRIRPILIMSLTAILALLPLTFGFGEGAALRTPMALAVIAGLVTSTILTLIVIPCVYDWVESLREKFHARS